MNPQVSIIIPTYNTGTYICESIDSVLNQSNNFLELLIIDDGSTDGTHNLIKPYLTNKKVFYLPKKNGGLSSARNYGIKNAKGNLVAFLDADDIWEKDKLKYQVPIFNQSNSIGMVFSDYSTFDTQGIVATNKLPQPLDNPLTYQKLFSRNNFIYPSTVICRKRVFEHCGEFDTMLNSIEDYDMWLRIANSGIKIANSNRPLVRIRQHTSNMSLNVSRMLENELIVIERNKYSFSRFIFLKRKAKIYYIAADRLNCQTHKKEALKMLLVAIRCWPLLKIDTLIVLTKIILGNKRTILLRRKFNNKNSILKKIYCFLYRHY